MLWKFGIPFESKPGQQLSSRDDFVYMELSSSCCAKLGAPLDLGWCSRGNLWSFPKEGKLLVMFDGEQGMVLEPMQGKWASF